MFGFFGSGSVNSGIGDTIIAIYSIHVVIVVLLGTIFYQLYLLWEEYRVVTEVKTVKK
jgi:hypothetical protein